MGLNLVMGSWYIWAFFRDAEELADWSVNNIQVWEEVARKLSGVVQMHTQAAYTGMQKYFQQEYHFLQRIRPGVGLEFGLLEEDLLEDFLLVLLREGEGKCLDDKSHNC